MRYIVNKNNSLRSVKAIKSLLELSRPIFTEYNLSQIKKEYALLMGYRNWEELIKYSQTIPQPVLDIQKITSPALIDFLTIFGKDSLLRILNNHQFKTPFYPLELSKKSIDYFKYIENINEIFYPPKINSETKIRVSLKAFLLGKNICLSEYTLKALHNEFPLNIICKNNVDQWISKPYGSMVIISPPGRGKTLFIETYVIKKLLENNKKIGLLKYHTEYSELRNHWTYLYNLPIIDLKDINQYDIIYIPDIYEPIKENVLKLLRIYKKPLITSSQYSDHYDDLKAENIKLFHSDPNMGLTIENQQIFKIE